MLVIFDVDGTLVDSQNLIVEAQAETFRRHGLPAPAREKTLSLVGLSLVPTFAALVGEDGPVDEMVATYREVFSDIIFSQPGRKEPLFPGVAELIDALNRNDKIILALATGKSRRGMARVFDHYGWHNVFSSVQTADTNASKPNPEMLFNALVETGSLPEQSVFIGDTSFDMEMGRAAGIDSWGVCWGYHRPELLQEAGASALFSTTSALLSAIEQRLENVQQETEHQHGG
jgi:phosphoglycolate phosphatase